MSIDYSPFEGDGRIKFQPTTGVLPGTHPTSVTRATARMLIRMMVEHGQSTHSGQGATLWIMLTWLQRHKRPYTLTAYPGLGYQLQLVTVTNLEKGVSFSTETIPLPELEK